MKKIEQNLNNCKEMNGSIEKENVLKSNQEMKKEEDVNAGRRLYEGEKQIPFDGDRVRDMWDNLGIEEEHIAAIENCGNGTTRYHDNGGDRTLVHIDQLGSVHTHAGLYGRETLCESNKFTADCIDAIQNGRKHKKNAVHILSEGIRSAGFQDTCKHSEFLKNRKLLLNEAANRLGGGHYLPLLVSRAQTRWSWIGPEKIEEVLNAKNIILEHADKCGIYGDPNPIEFINYLIADYAELLAMRKLLPAGWFNDEKLEKEAKSISDYVPNERERMAFEIQFTEREEIVLDKLKRVSRDSIPVAIHSVGMNFISKTLEEKINLIRIGITDGVFDSDFHPPYRESISGKVSEGDEEFIEFVRSLVDMRKAQKRPERVLEKALRLCQPFVHPEYTQFLNFKTLKHVSQALR